MFFRMAEATMKENTHTESEKKREKKNTKQIELEIDGL